METERGIDTNLGVLGASAMGWGHLTRDRRHGEAADQTVFCLTGGDKEAVRTKQPLTSLAHISSLTAADAVVKQKTVLLVLLFGCGL
ncbi:hypothetical protein JOQ06_009057, partial [Pogonophryne albipinna]